LRFILIIGFGRIGEIGLAIQEWCGFVMGWGVCQDAPIAIIATIIKDKVFMYPQHIKSAIGFC